MEKKLKKALETDIPRAIGRVGVNHFRDSFEMQRYNEAGSSPWTEVKRRQKGSGWYGFKYGNKGHFSSAATTRKILFGSGSSKLRDSIFVKEANARGVEWASSSDHATIHNRGGFVKVFGKNRAVMPKRQFMGIGTRLMGKIRFTIRTELKRALR
jgi:phage gpG-like protein